MSLHAPTNFTLRGIAGIGLIAAGLLLTIGVKKAGIGSDAAVRAAAALGTCLALAGAVFFSSYVHRLPFARMRDALVAIGLIGAVMVFRFLFL